MEKDKEDVVGKDMVVVDVERKDEDVAGEDVVYEEEAPEEVDNVLIM